MGPKRFLRTLVPTFFAAVRGNFIRFQLHQKNASKQHKH
jgi:hypothetical protein